MYLVLFRYSHGGTQSVIYQLEPTKNADLLPLPVVGNHVKNTRACYSYDFKVVSDLQDIVYTSSSKNLHQTKKSRLNRNYYDRCVFTFSCIARKIFHTLSIKEG